MIDQSFLDKPPAPDSGLTCLVMPASFHNVNSCAEQLSHRFAKLGPVFAANELPITIPCSASRNFGFVRAGQELEIKGRELQLHPTWRGPRRGAEHLKRHQRTNSAAWSTARASNSRTAASRSIELSPGMAMRAEVKTDKRRVIDYFLSPLKEYQDEGLRER